jgi:hypothetical protein
MDAKRKIATRRAALKRRKAQDVLRLSKKAKRELAKLLRRDRAGTITRVELQTGLKEIYQDVTSMTHFVRASL